MKLVKLLVLGLAFWAVVGLAQEIDSLDKEAVKYSQQGQFELAVQKWEEARSKLAPDSSLRKYLDISVDLAATYQSLGRLQRALEVLQEAKSVAEKGKDSLGLANVLGQFADVYLAIGNLEYKDGHFTGKTRQSALDENLKTAEGYLKEAWTLVKDTNHSLLKANILNKQGNLSMMQKSDDCAMEEKDKYDCAMEKYKEAAKENVTQDKLLNTKILVNLASAAVKSARGKLDHLIKEYKEVGFPGDVKQPKEMFEKAIETAKKSMDAALQQVMVLSSGDDDYRGEKLSALTGLAYFVQELHAALELKKNLPTRQSEFENLRSDAEKYLNGASKEWKDLKLSLGEYLNGASKEWKDLKLSLGEHLNSAINEWESMKSHLESSQQIALNEVKSNENKRVFDGIARRYRSAVTYAKIYLAESYAEQCRTEPPKCNKAVSFIERALHENQSYPLLQEDSSNKEFFIRNANNFVSNKFKIPQKDIPEECVAICNQDYSSPCGQDKLSERCGEFCREMPPLFLQDYHPEWLFRLEWQLGRVYKIQSEFGKAIEAYKQAATYLQLVQQTHWDTSPTFREHSENFQLDQADLFLQSASKAVTEGEQQNLLQFAIDSIESRQEKGLQNYFKDACITEKLSNRQVENQNRPEEKKLQGHEALFYPVVFDERIELLVKFSDGRIHRAKSQEELVTRKQLKEEIENFRNLLGVKDADKQTVESAKKLYNWLIKPVFGELQRHQIKTLLIVGSPELLRVPFGALVDEKDKYLIEYYALAILPNWKLVAALSNIAIDSHTERALLGSLSKETTANNGSVSPGTKRGENGGSSTQKPSSQCPTPESGKREEPADTTCEGAGSPLPYTGIEVNNLKSVMSPNDSLSGDKSFTKDSLKDYARKNEYSVIHLSTHGRFEEESSRSFLKTCNGDLTLDDLEDLLHGKEVELLTLSACETALGAELGLAGIGIKAKAHSALGTLWKVNDSSTALLITLFYQNWKGGNHDRAEALRKAQLSFLERSVLDEKLTKLNLCRTDLERFKHPYHWAGFLLVGDWLK